MISTACSRVSRSPRVRAAASPIPQNRASGCSKAFPSASSIGSVRYLKRAFGFGASSFCHAKKWSRSLGIDLTAHAPGQTCRGTLAARALAPGGALVFRVRQRANPISACVYQREDKRPKQSRSATLMHLCATLPSPPLREFGIISGQSSALTYCREAHAVR